MKRFGSLRLLPLTLWFALALGACARSGAIAPPPGGVPRPTPVPVDVTPDAWIESTLARLSLREKVGQMVVVWVGGEYLAAESDAFDRLREWIVQQGIGGIVISIGPPLEVAAKLNLLQQLADVPLLVAADMEHGPGQRLYGGVIMPYGIDVGGGTQFPPVMALGAANDEHLAYELGRITALEARAVGVHMVYAPVVDVNNNPANPIINTRSYGEDPARVAALVAAHVRGLQEHGVLATAKHFPGHGDTGTDSHIELPVISVDKARADSVELVPFRAAVRGGVAGVMSAHIAFPALTGDSVPATLNPKLLTALLRDELGFQGLTITDALTMGGIVRRYGREDAAVRAVQAGADVLLMPPQVPAAIDAVVAAVERGEIPVERIDRSVRKLLRAKAEVGLHERRTVELGRVPHVVGIRSHQQIAQRAAERSITVARDQQVLLPVEAKRRTRALNIIYSDDMDPLAGRTFQRTLAEHFRGLRTVFLDGRARAADLDSVIVAADTMDIVFFSAFVRVLAYKGDVAIAEPVAQLVTRLAARRPTIVTSFGNPYVLSQFPQIGTYVLAWGQEDVAQRAAVRALLGEIPITGKLPISLPPHHALGTGIRIEAATNGMDAARLDRIDALIRAAIAEGATPGAALAVGRRGQLVRLASYGRLDWDPASDAVTDSSLYDLASLTKVMGTTTAAMLLYEAGQLELDAPVAQYLPDWPAAGARGRITITHLLTHTSGLPAHGPLWLDTRGRAEYLRRIAELPLETAPGTRTTYSDFGIIVLGLALERIAGQPLDEFLRTRVWEPLDLRDTGFKPSLPAARIAPTERDTTFRHTHLRGVVHDENAFALGGVAAHAGLFSSARDLARVARLLLGGGTLDGVRLLRPETIQHFTRRQSAASSRALGWDTPSPGSSAGDYFSARSFGHTGFTGTSLWIDPERDLFVVLLTNRVNPTRANQKHVALRRAVHDAVQLALTDVPVTRRAAERR